MPAGYGAFNEGYDDTQNALFAANQEAQRNAALNALSKMYGPQAYDPTAALQMQTYGQNQQMDPLLVTQQQQTNQDNADKIQYNETSGYPTAAAENSDKIGMDNNALDTSNLSLAATKGLQMHQIMSGALANLGTSLQGVTDPGQRAAIFDQEATRLGATMGVDPQTAIQQLAPYKQAIVAQGADALPGIQNDLNSGLSSSLTPIDQAKLALINANIAKTQAGTAAITDKASGTGAKGAVDPILAASGAAEISGRQQKVLSTIQQMQALIPQLNTNTAARVANGASLLGVPINGGSAEYKFAQLAKTLAPSLSLDDINAIKQAGGPTMSRTNQQEFNAAHDALANLDLGQDPAALASQLANLQGIYGPMAGFAAQYAAKTNAAAQASANGATPGTTAPTTPGAVPLAPVQPASNMPGVPQALPGTQAIPLPPGQLGQAIQSVTSDPAAQAYLTNVSGIESDFGRNNSTSQAGAQGPFQFIGQTAQQYGVKDPQDPAQAAAGTLAYAQANSKYLAARGLPTDGASLYLAHQQGPQGAAKLLSADPNRLAAGLVGVKAVTENGMPANSTAGQFVQHWQQEYDNQAARLAGGRSGPLGSPSNPLMNPSLQLQTPQSQAQAALMNQIGGAAMQPAAQVPGAPAGGATQTQIQQVAQAADTGPLAAIQKLTAGPAAAPAPPAAASAAPVNQVKVGGDDSSGVVGTGSLGVNAAKAPPVKLLPWEQVLANSKALAAKYGVNIGKR